MTTSVSQSRGQGGWIGRIRGCHRDDAQGEFGACIQGPAGPYIESDDVARTMPRQPTPIAPPVGSHDNAQPSGIE